MLTTPYWQLALDPGPGHHSLVTTPDGVDYVV
jgi:hypothetical protein